LTLLGAVNVAQVGKKSEQGLVGLSAVKDHRVYRIPSVPWDWFDRPPSVNRLIGVRWLAQVLYPDRAKLDGLLKGALP